MAIQEITLKGLDGYEDHLVCDAVNGKVGDSLEECARSLFPQEGETMPRLRFQGFEGEWEKKLLSDCLEISDEKNTDNIYGINDVLSVSDDSGVVNQIELLGRSYAGKSVSGYKILRPGQIVYTKSPLRQKPYGIVKVNRGQTGIVSVLYAVYNVKDGVSAEYIHYYFDPAWRLNAYMRPLVNKGAKNTMNISDETALTGYILIPKNIEEQERIASFLRRIDLQMTLHHQQFERLKELKSACLGTMFPRGAESAPPIRFKDFDGEWAKTLLGSIFKERLESNVNGEMLSVTMNQGIIKASENGRFDNSNSDKSHYKVVKVDDIAYNSMRMWQGASGRSPYEGIVSPAYTVVTPIEGIDSEFFAYLFKTPAMVNLFKINSQGLTSDNWNLKYPAFSKIEAVYPKDIEEQKNIATFFHRIDLRIATEQQRLGQLKQMKSACLRSMFPQNGGGNLMPLVRFKGFNEEWITVCFAEMFTFLKNNSLSRADLGATGRVKNVHYGDVLIKFGEIIDMNKEELPYITNDTVADSLAENCQLRDGDVVFADAAEDNTVGKCAEMTSVGNDVVVSGLHTIPCRPNLVFSEGFLGYCLNANAFHDQLLPLIQGTKISSISKKALATTYITYPKSMDEQRNIASFFRSLDTKISLQTQRIEKLKQMKTACLNKMIA